MGPRDTALNVLIACRTQGAWADGALKEQIARDRLDKRDAALATHLVYGVLQNRLLLDHWLSAFLRGKTQPVVRDILRLAVCQIAFSDKIPPSAAVNEAVEQAKRRANPKAAGLVNAVLRNVLRAELTLPEDLSLRYSHPAELVGLLRQAVGAARLEPLLQSHNQTPPTAVQVNITQTTCAEVQRILEDEGYSVQSHPWLADCLLLRGGNLEQSEAYRNGLLYAQDPAAKLAVLAAAPEAGMSVLDCCAAPGGKSFAAAIQMQNRGQITSCDLHPHKIELIEKGAARLHLTCIQAMQQDARQPNPAWEERFDLVLCDVPCSGLGVIRKKPDIRYKELAPLENLPAIQRAILETQAAHVKTGGVLLYSTCTILPRENEDMVSAFLAAHREFQAEAFTLPNGRQAADGCCTLLPSEDDTDGFFIAKLRKTS